MAIPTTYWFYLEREAEISWGLRDSDDQYLDRGGETNELGDGVVSEIGKPDVAAVVDGNP